jgi:hypothetical protein
MGSVPQGNVEDPYQEAQSASCHPVSGGCMQVKLTTTVETVIDIDVENPEWENNFEQAKREIFGRFNDQSDSEDTCEGIKAAHSNAVVYDHVRTQSVVSTFEEVK